MMLKHVFSFGISKLSIFENNGINATESIKLTYKLKIVLG